MTPREAVAREVERLARRFVDRAAGPADADSEYRELLVLIRDLDRRFAFEDEGRAAAIDAVRNALPAMERDLLNAIIEDFGCELAAAAEAARHIAAAPRS